MNLVGYNRAVAEHWYYELDDAQGKSVYKLANIIARAGVLNETESVYARWTEPQSIGSFHEDVYRFVSQLRLVDQSAEDRMIFRLKTWSPAVLVSETVKAIIEATPNHGAAFQDV